MLCPWWGEVPIKNHRTPPSTRGALRPIALLLHDHRGSNEVAPVSLISRQTITRIAEGSETQEDSWRFRPNRAPLAARRAA